MIIPKKKLEGVINIQKHASKKPNMTHEMIALVTILIVPLTINSIGLRIYSRINHSQDTTFTALTTESFTVNKQNH